ncbi:RNA polymerase sigma factor [Streptomyces sp. NPDC020983]|uniref:RNA polymerase sigma factor n=1 Tax=Streptomyces sp. NPDC020983 TaxID=3365106 RepID=UPI00378F7544
MSALTPAPSVDDVFTAVYAQYRNMVRWTILDKLGGRDPQLADDLTQETFLKLYRLRDRIEFGPRISGLLRLMARQSVGRYYSVLRNTREVPADTGHWAYANRALAPAAGGTLKYVTAHDGDSDPDMDEALRRLRRDRGLAVAQ